MAQFNNVVDYIYLIHTREAIRANENVYKIGRSNQMQNKRTNSYPPGSKLLLQTICNDSRQLEKALIIEFKKQFRQCSGDYGTEYFEGDHMKMMETINAFVHEENVAKNYVKNEVKIINTSVHIEDVVKKIFPNYIEDIACNGTKKLIKYTLKNNELTAFSIKLLKNNIILFENNIFLNVKPLIKHIKILETIIKPDVVYDLSNELIRTICISKTKTTVVFADDNTCEFSETLKNIQLIEHTNLFHMLLFSSTIINNQYFGNIHQNNIDIVNPLKYNDLGEPSFAHCHPSDFKLNLHKRLAADFYVCKINNILIYDELIYQYIPYCIQNGKIMNKHYEPMIKSNISLNNVYLYKSNQFPDNDKDAKNYIESLDKLNIDTKIFAPITLKMMNIFRSIS